MIPATYDIEVYQGDDYDLPLRIRETNPDGSAAGYKDLTGYTVTAQIRSAASASTILATFTTTIADQNDATNGLGLVTLSLDHDTTAGLAATTAAPAVWDVQLVDPAGKVKTYLRGGVTIDAQVTR